MSDNFQQRGGSPWGTPPGGGNGNGSGRGPTPPDVDKIIRELARMNLTLNTYTQWYWKTDLLNLMNFFKIKSR